MGDGKIERHRRLVKFHNAVKSSRITADVLAEQCGISWRTMMRDIKYLREVLKAPLEWDNRDKSYSYTRPYELPALHVVLIVKPDMLALGLDPVWAGEINRTLHKDGTMEVNLKVGEGKFIEGYTCVVAIGHQMLTEAVRHRKMQIR